MKRTSTLALIAAVSTVSASAFAAPATPAAPEAKAATALPGCFSVRHTTGIATQTVYVSNRCSYGVRWYIDREGPNSPCYYTGPGRSSSVRWRKNDAYHGTYRC
jgi:hypothetical protein